jgi:drug/metabolite transporter (DMT)-like permease
VRQIAIMNVLLYMLLCLIWGTTWLVIKVGYGGLEPFNVAAIRFFVAGAVLALLIPVLGVPWPRGRREWRVVVWIGLAMFAADYGLIYWAEQYIDSGLTAVLFAVMPVVTIFLAHFFVPDSRLTARKMVGTLLAFGGIVALFGERVRLDPSDAWPMAAIVAAAVCASVATIVSKNTGASLHPAALNAPAMLLGAAALSIVSIATGGGFRLPRDASTWGAILYLAVAGSVISFLAYFSLLKTWSVTSLSFISIFTPAIALLLGVVLLDEHPTALTALGGVLILTGVTVTFTTTRLSLGGARSRSH